MELHPLINSIGNLFEAVLIVSLFARTRTQKKHIDRIAKATIKEAELLDQIITTLERNDDGLHK